MSFAHAAALGYGPRPRRGNRLNSRWSCALISPGNTMNPSRLRTEERPLGVLDEKETRPYRIVRSCSCDNLEPIATLTPFRVILSGKPQRARPQCRWPLQTDAPFWQKRRAVVLAVRTQNRPE